MHCTSYGSVSNVRLSYVNSTWITKGTDTVYAIIDNELVIRCERRQCRTVRIVIRFPLNEPFKYSLRPFLPTPTSNYSIHLLPPTTPSNSTPSIHCFQQLPRTTPTPDIHTFYPLIPATVSNHSL